MQAPDLTPVVPSEEILYLKLDSFIRKETDAHSPPLRT